MSEREKSKPAAAAPATLPPRDTRTSLGIALNNSRNDDTAVAPMSHLRASSDSQCAARAASPPHAAVRVDASAESAAAPTCASSHGMCEMSRPRACPSTAPKRSAASADVTSARPLAGRSMRGAKPCRVSSADGTTRSGSVASYTAARAASALADAPEVA